MNKQFFPAFMAVIILSSLTLTAYADELPPNLSDLLPTTTDTTTLTETSTPSSTETQVNDDGSTATPMLTSADSSTIVPTSAAVTTSTSTDAATHAPAFQDFTDVPVSHPDYNAIIVLRYQGVVKGYDDNSFHPDQNLNRVEALKLIFEASNVAMTQGVASANFQDTKNDAWYSGYLNRAVFMEIVNGYSDGTFKPEKPVNLVEFLKMLELAQKADLTKTNLNQIPYSDVQPGEWYSKYINYAKINDLLSPDSDNKVHPDQPVTRAQAAEIIYRFRNMLAKPKPSTPTTPSTPSTDSTSSPISLQENMALYVSTGYKFAIQYPKLWFYSALDNDPESKAIHTYGFGNKDLSENPPIITLELLADDANFVTNSTYNNIQYYNLSSDSKVSFSIKINGSSRIYRLSGPTEQSSLMLAMLSSLTSSIDGISSYNPAEKTDNDSTTTTSDVTTSTTSDTTTTP